MRRLHELPKFRDRWAYLYLERGRLDQSDKGLLFHDEAGDVPVPIDQLSLVMLGPGTTVTHAAVKARKGFACARRIKPSRLSSASPGKAVTTTRTTGRTRRPRTGLCRRPTPASTA
jgi:hypothetical protein